MIVFLTINAQNYQTYHSDKSVTFGNQYEGLKFQKVDSVAISQGDSILWFFPNFDMEDYYCVQPNGSNWSGKKLIIKQNGDNVFFNKNNDSILLKTHANLLSPWVAYSNPDSYNITAAVIHHDTLTFLGITDSVKTIGFQVYDTNNESITHVLNNKYLQISKQYGLIKTFLFRDFPDYHSNWPHIEYDIKGISSPEIGIQNLTWKEVFDDFYPGDELHVLTESCYGTLDDSSCSFGKSIFKYLSRIEYQDSIKYTIERLTSSKTKHNGVLTGYIFIHDTITSKISFHSNNNFNKFSEESIIQGDVISYNLQSTKHMDSGKYVMTKTIDLYDYLEKVSDDCWEFPISDVLTINSEYMKGLGGPYYSASMWDSYSLRKPVFYKKGYEEWGTPLSIVDETGIRSANEPIISVFPNPAKDNIWVQTDLGIQFTFEIIDLRAQVLISEFIEYNYFQIDTSELKAGVYLYKIRKGDKILKTGKILIHK